MTWDHFFNLLHSMEVAVRVVVVGECGVGKSNLVIRFTNDTFLEEYDPTIEECFRHQFDLEGSPIRMDVLDSAGAEYDALFGQIIRHGEGFLLLFSITSRSSFEKAKEYRERIVQARGPNIFLVFVGTKCDLEESREVASGEAEALAADFHCIYLETSAKDRVNVAEPFLCLTKLILGRPLETVNRVPRKME